MTKIKFSWKKTMASKPSVWQVKVFSVIFNDFNVCFILSMQYYRNIIWWVSNIFFVVNYNPSRRGLNLHDVHNPFLKAIIKFFQARIVLQGRSLDIPFWVFFYILQCIEHKRFNWCSFISNRIRMTLVMSKYPILKMFTCLHATICFLYIMRLFTLFKPLQLWPLIMVS